MKEVFDGSFSTSRAAHMAPSGNEASFPADKGGSLACFRVSSIDAGGAETTGLFVNLYSLAMCVRGMNGRRLCV